MRVEIWSSGNSRINYLSPKIPFVLKLKIRLNPWMSISVALVLLLVFRWFWMIDSYSVNVLFWDQWGFYSVFFDGGSLWDVFSHQHGPHRQGIGFVLAGLVADLSSWDTRAEAFVIGGLIVVAGLLTLYLKKRLTGNFQAIDWILFILIISPAQYGLFAATPNISHGSMPFLLLILYGISWQFNGRIKYFLICLINFLMIYTGFGFFIGPITILLFAFELFRTKGQKVLKTIALSISLLSLASFFIDYNFNHPEALAKEVDNSSFYSYLNFIFIGLANFWSLIINNVWDSIFGAINFILIGGILIHAIRALWKNPNNSLQKVIFIFSAFTLLFLINLSLGRTPYGIGGATASRYIIYITPAYIALYLYFSQLEFGSYFWKLFFVLATLYPTFNTAQYYRKMETIKNNKNNWVAAYKETEDIDKANEISGFKIFPKPEKVQLKKKLDYLKEKKLNLYKLDLND